MFLWDTRQSSVMVVMAGNLLFCAESTGVMIMNMTMRSRYDDLDISVVVVAPEGAPKAVVQFSHGMCGCKERFLPVMRYMAERGVACVAGDHRGHGGSVKSLRDLGYMYDGGYKALVDDMRMITEWAKVRFPDVPVYLLGHSMGSLAARVYVKDDDSEISGLILCGTPAWTPLAYLGRILTWMICMAGLSRHRMSVSQSMASQMYNRRFRHEGEQAWTCSDADSRRSAMENPLCNFRFTANGSYNLFCLMVETFRKGKWMLSHPEMPVYFISGSDDPVMVNENGLHDAAINMLERGYSNVISAIYPNMRHEVLNEIGKEKVWNDILNFVTGNG